MNRTNEPILLLLVITNATVVATVAEKENILKQPTVIVLHVAQEGSDATD
jgi:hypothetical protein